MTYDAVLEADTQTFTNTCPTAHSTYPAGENIYFTSYPSWFPTPSASTLFADAVTDWYREEADYDYAAGASGTGRVVGHFTQVVWRASTRVGCGYITGCPSPWGGSSQFDNAVVVCRYLTPANYGGQFLAEVGEPIATASQACAYHATCSDAPAPTSPPPSPPPRLPPSPASPVLSPYTVTQSVLAAAALEDVDLEGLTSSYAALCNVQEEQVSVTASSASVRLTFVIRLDREADADDLMSTLGAQSTESLSSALGLAVTSIEGVSVLSTVQPPASPPSDPHIFSLPGSSLTLEPGGSGAMNGVAIAGLVLGGCFLAMLAACLFARWRTRRYMAKNNLGRLANWAP